MNAVIVIWVIVLALYLTGCAATDIEAEAVCDEWEQVVPSYDDKVDSKQTVAEVKRNQDIFVAVCEE